MQVRRNSSRPGTTSSTSTTPRSSKLPISISTRGYLRPAVDPVLPGFGLDLLAEAARGVQCQLNRGVRAVPLNCDASRVQQIAYGMQRRYPQSGGGDHGVADCWLCACGRGP
jgi:hypothetical protein